MELKVKKSCFFGKLVLTAFIVGLFSGFAGFADEAGNAGKSFQFSELGQKAAEKADSSSLGIKAVYNGAEIVCKLQAIEASVTRAGISIKSTSQSEGAGAFSMSVSGLGREEGRSAPVMAGLDVKVYDTCAQVIRPELVEEYTVSGDGIRQDFIVSKKPEGSGGLALAVSLGGATCELSDTGIKIRITESVREFAYSKLLVSDSTGRRLPAEFKINSSNGFIVSVDDSNAIYPIRIDPTLSDVNWVGIGSCLADIGIGSIYAVACDLSGNLYVGGSFTIAGDVAVNNIARWNGSRWNALGSGLSDSVQVLACDSSGNLYAGGKFKTAGGVSAKHIAKWNGSRWSALGSGTDDDVKAIAFDSSGNLYAGGWFNVAGGVPADRIAKWNGLKWSALGTGLNGNVAALSCDSSGNIYAGGGFTAAGAVSATYIAKWNGTAWSAIGTGMDKSVAALAFDSSGNLYAGGEFTTAGGVSAKYIAKWNGTIWSALGTGMNGSVAAIALDSSGNIYSGGGFTTAGGVLARYIAKWNGTSWSALKSGMDSSVVSLAMDSSGNLYAGGGFSTAGGVSANRIAKWNGTSTTWSALKSGKGNGTNLSISALACDSYGNLYAGGGFNAAGGVSANYIAKWNGTAWSALGTGMNGIVYALACDSSGSLYAGGGFTSAGGVPANYIAKWNGTAWSALGAGMNNTITTLAFDLFGSLYAGGGFTTAGGSTVNRIAKWNGTAWSALGTGVDGTVYAIACNSSGNLYAGGVFTKAGGVPAKYIARWNGNSWSALGAGMDWYVYALACDSSGNLYAGGGFTTAGGVPATCIAKWKGTSWSAVGAGMDGYVDAIAFDSSGNLYAGGGFATAGGVPATRIAKWNGTSWSAIGTGINGRVAALALDSSGNLCAGGVFTTAGGKLSTNLAKYLFPHTLTYSAGVNGSISGTTPQTANHGTDILPVTANPDTDYHFVDWTGSGAFTSTNNPLNMSNVTKDMTFTANFARNMESLLVNKVGVGTVAGSGTFSTQTISLPITATDSGNSHFVNWTSTGEGIITDPSAPSTSVTLTSPRHGTTFTATANFFDATTNTLNTDDIVSSLSGSKGGFLIYKINVPSGRKFLNVAVTGMTGDCDLYLRYGKIPSTMAYDYRSTKESNANESITALNPLDGDWYIMLHAYDNYTGATLSVNHGAVWIEKPTNLNGIAGTPADKKIVLSWNSVAGAASYEIFRSDVDNIELAAKLNTTVVTGTSYNDDFAVAGTYHCYYWVRAVDGAGNKSEFSDSAYGATAEGAVTTLVNGTAKSAIAGHKDSVRIFKITVPEGQKLLEFTLSGGTGDCDVLITAPLAATVKKSISGSSSEYIPFVNPAKGEWTLQLRGMTDFVNVMLKAKYSTTALVVPSGLLASDGLFDDRILLNWNPVPGATSYEVFRNTTKLPPVSGNKIAEVADNTYEDTNVVVGTVYYYFVTAKNIAATSKPTAGNSGFLMKAPILAPAAPIVSDGIFFDKISVQWAKYAGATSYMVFRTGTLIPPDPDVATPIAETTALFVYDFGDDIVPQVDGVVKKYYYWIAFRNSNGLTVISKPKTGSLSNKGPAKITASNGTYSDRIIVTWTEVSGATAYDVYRYTDNLMTQDETKKGSAVAALEYEDNPPAADTVYYYRVKAKYGANYDSEFSLVGAAGKKATGALAPTATVLDSGVASSSKSGPAGPGTYFSADVPMGTSRLVAFLNGVPPSVESTNDCDLFAKFAYYPTKSSFTAKAVEDLVAKTEILTVNNPAPGTWYFLLYGTSAYSNVTLTVKCYSVTDIVLTQVPSNDLAVPFTAAFKGKVVDEIGTGIPNMVVQARDPIRGLTASLAKTDAKGVFSYSALINSEGEHTFDFYFTEMPDIAKGTASHTVATRKGCFESNNFFDMSFYLPAKPVPVALQSDITGLQNLLGIRNGWAGGAIDTDYETMWINSTVVKAKDDAQLVGKLDEGLYMFFYGVEGAGVGNDTTTIAALSTVPFVVHVENSKLLDVLAALNALGVIDGTQKDAIRGGSVGIVAVASLNNPDEGLIPVSISLLACEQLELLAKLAGNNGVSGAADVKYSDVASKQVTVTLASGRRINVVSAAFVK